jgi:hypothetical protein
MRFKISISVPGILAIIPFVIGMVGILYYNLTVINGEFSIRVGVPTIPAYLISLGLLVAFSFVLLRKICR